jgi:hypothetical protein
MPCTRRLRLLIGRAASLLRLRSNLGEFTFRNRLENRDVSPNRGPEGDQERSKWPRSAASWRRRGTLEKFSSICQTVFPHTPVNRVRRKAILGERTTATGPAPARRPSTSRSPPRTWRRTSPQTRTPRTVTLPSRSRRRFRAARSRRRERRRWSLPLRLGLRTTCVGPLSFGFYELIVRSVGRSCKWSL